MVVVFVVQLDTPTDRDIDNFDCMSQFERRPCNCIVMLVVAMAPVRTVVVLVLHLVDHLKYESEMNRIQITYSNPIRTLVHSHRTQSTAHMAYVAIDHKRDYSAPVDIANNSFDSLDRLPMDRSSMNIYLDIEHFVRRLALQKNKQ